MKMETTAFGGSPGGAGAQKPYRAAENLHLHRQAADEAGPDATSVARSPIVSLALGFGRPFDLLSGRRSSQSCSESPFHSSDSC